jgi:GH24 family phage-related lysozyme (muramidase)
MAINPDPRPGRWLLPLVVLGMMLFTFVFVTRLPGAEPVVTTSPPGDNSTTTAPLGSTTVATTVPIDPALQTYRDALTALATELAGFQTEMIAVNEGWDADPKTIDAATAKSRLTALRDQTATWAAAIGQLTVPVGMEANQAAIAEAANRAAAAAESALTGFTSAPGPEQRRQAVTDFSAASTDFTAAVSAV